MTISDGKRDAVRGRGGRDRSGFANGVAGSVRNGFARRNDFARRNGLARRDGLARRNGSAGSSDCAAARRQLEHQRGIGNRVRSRHRSGDTLPNGRVRLQPVGGDAEREQLADRRRLRRGRPRGGRGVGNGAGSVMRRRAGMHGRRGPGVVDALRRCKPGVFGSGRRRLGRFVERGRERRLDRRPRRPVRRAARRIGVGPALPSTLPLSLSLSLPLPLFLPPGWRPLAAPGPCLRLQALGRSRLRLQAFRLGRLRLRPRRLGRCSLRRRAIRQPAAARLPFASSLRRAAGRSRSARNARRAECRFGGDDDHWPPAASDGPAPDGSPPDAIGPPFDKSIHRKIPLHDPLTSCRYSRSVSPTRRSSDQWDWPHSIARCPTTLASALS